MTGLRMGCKECEMKRGWLGETWESQASCYGQGICDSRFKPATFRMPSYSLAPKIIPACSIRTQIGRFACCSCATWRLQRTNRTGNDWPLEAVPVRRWGTVHWRTCMTFLKPIGHYMYRQFNIQQFYVLPTQCIYGFCVDLRTNSDYFPIQH